MCQFLSWIAMPDGSLVYLTKDDLDSKRGRELKKYLKDSLSDLVGHGAIEWFYNMKPGQGKHQECSDFSKPGNFPNEIVQAVKDGKFRDMGVAEGLLSKTAWAKYERVRDTTLAKYKQVEGPALAEYKQVIDTAWAKYKQVTDTAWAKYEQVIQKAFWDLFSDLENRVEDWK